MDTSQIGEAAGELWKRLAHHGPLLLKDIPKTAGLDRTLVHLAVGWLAREGKVICEEKGSDLLVSLTEDELTKNPL